MSAMPRVHTPKAQEGSAGDRKCKDPDCDMDCGRRHNDTTRAFVVDEVSAIFRTLEDGDRADLGDLLAFLFGTGARIREALECVAWSDVDLDQGVVRVRGTKTLAADRSLGLSPDLTERLRDRAQRHGRTGQVFGITRFETKLGQPRDVSNVLKQIRRVLDASGCPWAGSHTFRRTVATWMDREGHPIAEIADQLGHANVSVTMQYLGRKPVATGGAKVMILPKG